MTCRYRTHGARRLPAQFRKFSAWLMCPLQPARLIVAPTGDGCKRMVADRRSQMELEIKKRMTVPQSRTLDCWSQPNAPNRQPSACWLTAPAILSAGVGGPREPGEGQALQRRAAPDRTATRCPGPLRSPSLRPSPVPEVTLRRQ
jgi:hypothetical protein